MDICNNIPVMADTIAGMSAATNVTKPFVDIWHFRIIIYIFIFLFVLIKLIYPFPQLVPRALHGNIKRFNFSDCMAFVEVYTSITVHLCHLLNVSIHLMFKSIN